VPLDVQSVVFDVRYGQYFRLPLFEIAHDLLDFQEFREVTASEHEVQDISPSGLPVHFVLSLPKCCRSTRCTAVRLYAMPGEVPRA